MLLQLALLLPAAEAAEHKRVVIVHFFGRDFAPCNLVGSTLRTDLARPMRQPLVTCVDRSRVQGVRARRGGRHGDLELVN
jgi:hypothetical protein